MNIEDKIDKYLVNEKSIKPEPVPNDPEQKLNIKCAVCGKPIDFRKKEVYSNKSSYVCKKHAN